MLFRGIWCRNSIPVHMVTKVAILFPLSIQYRHEEDEEEVSSQREEKSIETKKKTSKRHRLMPKSPKCIYERLAWRATASAVVLFTELVPSRLTPPPFQCS